MGAYLVPALACACALLLGLDLTDVAQAALGVLHWLLEVVRTNYLLQGLIGSMCMGWVSGMLQLCATALKDGARALCATRLEISMLDAPRQYNAIKKYVRKQNGQNIAGDAVVAPFDHTYSIAATVQYVRAARTYLPTLLRVNGQLVFLYEDTLVYVLYVLGTRRFNALRACMDAISKDVETQGSCFTVMMLDENLKWTPQHAAKARSADTLFLDPEVKQTMLDDARTFFAAKADYERLGQAWRRSHFYTGRPGCGKTSTAVVIASELGVPLCILNFSNSKLNDTTLSTALCNAPSPGIILLEDIDCMGVSVSARSSLDVVAAASAAAPLNVQSKQALKCNVTQSGFLNALDGPCAHVGHLVITTTNHESLIDPAATRERRLGDVRFDFNHLDDLRASTLMFAHFLPALTRNECVTLALSSASFYSLSRIESQCMGFAPFMRKSYTLLDVQKHFHLVTDTDSNPLERCGVFRFWVYGLLDIWPDYLRKFGGTDVIASIVSPRQWRQKHLSFPPHSLVSRRPDISERHLRIMFAQFLRPLCEADLRRVTALLQSSKLAADVLSTIVSNNVDSIEACCDAVRVRSVFKEEYLRFVNEPYEWRDVVPFIFTEPFDKLQLRCKLMETVITKPGGNWSTLTASEFANLPVADMQLLQDTMANFDHDGPVNRIKPDMQVMQRCEVANRLHFAKAIPLDVAWALARRLCPCSSRDTTLISSLWFNHFISTLPTSEEAIEACLRWEAEFRLTFARA